jgi:Tol biopolymer transport system component
MIWGTLNLLGVIARWIRWRGSGEATGRSSPAMRTLRCPGSYQSLAALLSLVVCLTACAQAKPVRLQEDLKQKLVDRESRSPVVSITIIKEEAGRLDWSHNLDLIAFDRRGEDGYYDVHVMRSDGSGETCLTCDKPGLPGSHMGNPAWYPSGDYIVFQAEKPVHEGRSTKALPGYGIDSDLWLITRDGKHYYQLTDVSPDMGVLHPHFSHDGSKLLWTEKVGEGGEYGVWALKVADFIIDESGPHLANIKTYQPGGEVFREGHGFSKDDTKVIFSGNLEPGQAEFAIDVYTLDLKTEKLERLTSTMDEWDEHAQYSPSGNKVVWMSTMGCNCNPARSLDLRADYWLMDADGLNKLRLTYFNEPGSAEYTGERIVAADSAWSPDGTKLAALLIVLDGGLRELFGFASLEGRIVMIAFDAPQ